jgi:hypothetical protein
VKFSFEGDLYELIEFAKLIVKQPPKVQAPVETRVDIQDLEAARLAAAKAPPPAYQRPDTDADPAYTLPGLPEDTLQTTAYLPELTAEQRSEAWNAFKKFCEGWALNFEVEGAPQPDRVKLMFDLGSGRHPIAVLVMAYEIESLQSLVRRALKEVGVAWADDLDKVDRMAANMIQVSHSGFADLAGTYDYTTRWRRKEIA